MKLIVPFIIMMLAVLVPSSYGDMYKWVDEEGTVHFTDDLSTIPEKYREDVESLKLLKETSTPHPQEMFKSPLPAEVTEPKGITVDLVRKGEVSFTRGPSE